MSGNGTIDFHEFQSVILGEKPEQDWAAFAVGDKVEYDSSTLGGWMETQVTEVAKNGAIQLACKPNFWMSLDVQSIGVRKAGGGGYA